jgi:hypothetical protein
VKKLALIVVALVGIGMLVPQSRARIFDLMAPLGLMRGERAARRHLDRIAVDLQRTEARTGAFPQPAAFGEWLRENYGSDRDPWGSPYYLAVYADSFVVGSPGEDTRWLSEDDLRLVMRREVTAAGLGSALTPPAPPSGGVKSSAIRKAQEAAKREP